MSKKKDIQKFMQVEAGEDQHVDTDFFGNMFAAEAGCILEREGETSGEEILEDALHDGD
ncbi:MAG: hypothetical protein FWF59_07510 [Turicibacter sp.]|nr:hypothetical protein [Turicibacter sp.]